GDQLAGDKVVVLRAQAGEGLAVVAVGHEEDDDQAVGDELDGQGDDEGMELVLGNEEAVDRADEAADDDNGHQRDQDAGPAGIGGQEAEDAAIAHLLQGHGNGGGQAHHAAGRKVGTGQNDTAADAQCDGQVRGNLGEDVG